VDVAGLVGGEKDGQVGNVVGLAPAFERDGVGENLVEVLVVEVLVVEELTRQRGLGVSRANPVDPDPLVAVLDRQAAREVRLRPLGCVVDRLARMALESRRRDEVDDVAAVALAQKLLDGLLRRNQVPSRRR
jgi:hypothetical protein